MERIDLQSVPDKITPMASRLLEVGNAGPTQLSGDTGKRPPAGRSATRHPDQLKLHPALQKVGWTGLVDEVNDAAQVKEQALCDPILITEDATILSGFGRWRLALLQHQDEIPCIEYPFDENQSLQFILAHHRPVRAWNPFIRTCVALTLVPHFQQRALENMRSGGKYKGSAKLPEAQVIDVRQEIAVIAGVGARNVSNVQFILAWAHPRIKDALRDSRLTINRALRLCKLPYSKQLEQFTRDTEVRNRKKIIRRAIANSEPTTASLDVLAVLRDLQQREAERPGSVLVRIGSEQDTIILTLAGFDYCLYGKGS